MDNAHLDVSPKTADLDITSLFHPIPFDESAEDPTLSALSWAVLRQWLDSLGDVANPTIDVIGGSTTTKSDSFVRCGSHTDSVAWPSQVDSPSCTVSICSLSKCCRSARTNGLCKEHGGLWECHVDGCTREAVFIDYCVDHGGGRGCKIVDCLNAAQSQGLCKAHGGGARCKFDLCEKSSQGGGLCRAHGGGKRCTHEGCGKGVQRGNKCTKHGGLCEFHRKDRLCTVEGCKHLSHALGMCKRHMRQHRNQEAATQAIATLWQ
ncbi:hypothetical protein H310_10298 [Aphanomyces invadans]|uniref:WRKY19-like zinc finger domain-containing protein n=1 Tax=Aphanomyces invadans TaxID=157072 RepID=A0A024TSI5_9STRA|nr:hypothetical protein H310_10298 [Aphanomyces invadans]ETV96596.1 hypothetical protein H310_10298 [Aphanomyces invadans]|eukprot:XP_008874859.1 hypothetical protein H310_10298 [Aphanomyces invadans]